MFNVPLDSDYVSFDVNLTIPLGQSSISYNVTILDDVIPEPTEIFVILYSVVSGSFTERLGSSTVTIQDTDSKYSKQLFIPLLIMLQEVLYVIHQTSEIVQKKLVM